MICLSRLGGKEFFLNDELIEFMERTPDTVLSLTTGKKIIVSQTPEEICDKIIEFRRNAANALPPIDPSVSERIV